jgi:hypothetical protein
MTYEFFTHSAGTCDLCVLENVKVDKSLITVGVDGEIKMFNPKNPSSPQINSYSCTDPITCIAASPSVCKLLISNIHHKCYF